MEQAGRAASGRDSGQRVPDSERRAKRSFFRFHDGRVVAVVGDYPNARVLYDGPERRKTPHVVEVTPPEKIFYDTATQWRHHGRKPQPSDG